MFYFIRIRLSVFTFHISRKPFQRIFKLGVGGRGLLYTHFYHIPKFIYLFPKGIIKLLIYREGGLLYQKRAVVIERLF